MEEWGDGGMEEWGDGGMEGEQGYVVVHYGTLMSVVKMIMRQHPQPPTNLTLHNATKRRLTETHFLSSTVSAMR